jgi:hypothetical protein
MKNSKFSSVQIKFEPGSAGPVHGSTHPLPAVWFWFTVQANTPENQSELNFGIHMFDLENCPLGVKNMKLK